MTFLYPLKYTLFVVLFIIVSVGCTTTSTTTKKARKPKEVYDVSGNRIIQKLTFAGVVVTGFDVNSTEAKKSEWLNSNFKYSQHILGLSDPTPERISKLSAYFSAAFDNVTNPEFSVSLSDTGLSDNEAKAFVFAIDEETISQESFGEFNLTTVDLSGQIIVFDWKEKLLLASYPVLLVAKRKQNPTDDLLDAFDKLYFNGWGENSVGMFDIFINRMQENLSLTRISQGLNMKVGVDNVSIEEEAISELPQKYSKNQASLKDYENFLAQQFLLYLAKNQNLATVPYGEKSGESRGNRTLDIIPGGGSMLKKFSDSTEANRLQIPDPDYSFDINLKKLVEVEAKKSEIDKIVVFGSAIDLTAKIHFNEDIQFSEYIKKGIQERFPLRNLNYDKWRYFLTCQQTLFQEITQNLSSPNSKWAKSSGSGSSLQKKFREFYNNHLSKCALDTKPSS
jgi:hypothetical protein